MVKPFDVAKLRKSLTKSIEGIGVGFNDPTDWISTGNYALNYLISGDFKRGIPLGKVTVFAGESGCLPASAIVTVKIDFTVKNITVKELRELYHNDVDLEIDTPDGFQKIGKWFDKGVMEMIKIVTPNHETICAKKHLIQTDTSAWIYADDLDMGEVIQTKSGNEPVTSFVNMPDEECYDFEILHPNHRYYGDGIVSHNSGKSFICSGNLVRNAQQQGVFVVIIDSENALDEQWLHALGVDTSEDKLLKLNIAMVDDVAKIISEFMKEYKSQPAEDKQKVLFVVDSLGMLLTPTDVNQFEAGELKGDLGRKAKSLTALVRNCVNMFGSENVGLVATNHSYASQDPYNPDPKISGGDGVVYASSIVVAMKKLKLKEDEDGNKTTEVLGIRSGCKIMKTRYSKPFEDIEIKIPYAHGMDVYSGLFDLLEKKKILSKEGNRYCYKDNSGEIHKYFRKEWNKNTNGIMDLVMDEVMKNPKKLDKELVIDETEENSIN
jgi:RecA/RadA recombinase